MFGKNDLNIKFKFEKCVQIYTNTYSVNFISKIPNILI